MSQPLTVFTPTYNRAYILDRLYQSLVAQSDSRFIWMVVDDGSSDGTKDLIAGWKQAGLVEIEYIYKENHGMHSAHNVAFDHIRTPLCVCIDSDDYMPQDGVERILKHSDALLKDEGLAGIIGLDADTKGDIIGTPFPQELKRGTINQAIKQFGVRGDKKLVLKSSVINRYPRYPLFEGERLVPLGTLYLLIEQDYQFEMHNEIFCHVEYMPDGSTQNILRQYRRNPRGFAHERVLRLKYDRTFKGRMRQWIHLISSCLFVRSWKPMNEARHKWMFLLAWPFGLALHLYIRYHTRK